MVSEKSYCHSTNIAKTLKAAKAIVLATFELQRLGAEIKDWNIGIGERDGIVEVELVDKKSGSCTWWEIK